MSRTWRKVPKQTGKPRAVREERRGGAIASSGPSPERCRPETDYDEKIHLAAELLEQTAEQLRQPENFAARGSDATQTLWYMIATSNDCPYDLLSLPADLLLPTIHVAQQAVKQAAASEETAAVTPELFARAADLLRAMANSGRAKESTRTKDQIVPDGRQKNSHVRYWRDNRVTGLRGEDHRRARREAKLGLADPESAETVRTGKNRRYTDKHGNYEL